MLDIDQVRHIAKLARLKLIPKEEQKFSTQLSSILEYVEQLNEVDTKSVEPLSSVAGLESVYQEDEILESGIGHDDIAKNAPEFKDGFFVVPGVFE
ncbi:MAG TPA: Asp-tRNA(Asn)/Glu-tRNA(Gln) amidotransferase subunit GatC [bacterium]|nr:Asp-tRNA(Asn)/Glu-tRNA(Gln) amidotransferase subunit GatC [bacterium]